MEFETPYLQIDGEVFRKNSEQIVGGLENNHIAIRSHFKSHKALSLAEVHYEMGIRRFATARVSEAEMLAATFPDVDVVVTTPPVDKTRAQVLIELTRQCRDTACTVDSAEQIALFAGAAGETKYPGLWIAVDCGLGREGVRSLKQLDSVINAIKLSAFSKVRGLSVYLGHLFSSTERQNLETYRKLSEFLEPFRERMRTAGFSAALSVGSSPCLEFFHLLDGVDEARVGTAYFGDASSVSLHGRELESCAATVVVRVVSVNSKTSIVIDAGSKTLARQAMPYKNVSVYGLILEYPDLLLTQVHEELGIVDCTQSAQRPRFGEPLTILPVNIPLVFGLFSKAVLRDRDVVRLIEIEARDCRR